MLDNLIWTLTGICHSEHYSIHIINIICCGLYHIALLQICLFANSSEAYLWLVESYFFQNISAWVSFHAMTKILVIILSLCNPWRASYVPLINFDVILLFSWHGKSFLQEPYIWERLTVCMIRTYCMVFPSRIDKYHFLYRYRLHFFN